ncbi:MAG: hypothetical protein ACI8RA_002574 [Chlamydiales bacterium]|jgi:hypothetical protein
MNGSKFFHGLYFHDYLVLYDQIQTVLCRKEERKISKSLEVQYKHKTYQLISKGNGRRLAGKTAMVAEHVDGIRIEFDGEEYRLHDLWRPVLL